MRSDGSQVGPMGKVAAGKHRAVVTNDIAGIAHHDRVVQPLRRPTVHGAPIRAINALEDYSIFADGDEGTIQETHTNEAASDRASLLCPRNAIRTAQNNTLIADCHYDSRRGGQPGEVVSDGHWN